MRTGFLQVAVYPLLVENVERYEMQTVHHQKITAMEESNSSNNCNTSSVFPASTRDLIEVAEKSEVFVIVLACAFSTTLLTTGIFIENSAHILGRDKSSIRFHRILITGLYPVFALASALSLIVPFAAPCATLVAHLYFSVVLFIFALLLTGNFGRNGKLMSAILGRPIIVWPRHLFNACPIRQRRMSPLTGPKFLTAVRVTLRVAAIILPSTAAVELITVLVRKDSEKTTNVSVLFIVAEFAKYLPSLLAIQATMTFYLMADDVLKSTRVKPELFTVIVVLTLSGLQDPTAFLIHHFIDKKCQPIFISIVGKLYFRSVLIVFEMFIANFVITIWSRWGGIREEKNKAHHHTYLECFYKVEVAHHYEAGVMNPEPMEHPP